MVEAFDILLPGFGRMVEALDRLLPGYGGTVGVLMIAVPIAAACQLLWYLRDVSKLAIREAYWN